MYSSSPTGLISKQSQVVQKPNPSCNSEDGALQGLTSAGSVYKTAPGLASSSYICLQYYPIRSCPFRQSQTHSYHTQYTYPLSTENLSFILSYKSSEVFILHLFRHFGWEKVHENNLFSELQGHSALMPPGLSLSVLQQISPKQHDTILLMLLFLETLHQDGTQQWVTLVAQVQSQPTFTVLTAGNRKTASSYRLLLPIFFVGSLSREPQHQIITQGATTELKEFAKRLF